MVADMFVIMVGKNAAEVIWAWSCNLPLLFLPWCDSFFSAPASVLCWGYCPCSCFCCCWNEGFCYPLCLIALILLACASCFSFSVRWHWSHIQDSRLGDLSNRGVLWLAASDLCLCEHLSNDVHRWWQFSQQQHCLGLVIKVVSSRLKMHKKHLHIAKGW